MLLGGCVTGDSESSQEVSAYQEGAENATQQGASDIAQEVAASTSSNVPKGAKKYNKTYSGLMWRVLREGTGRRPTRYNSVEVHYQGFLPDGTIFDSSYARGRPMVLTMDKVIAAWREGLPLMKEGAKYRFVVPPHLAYGEHGAPPKIGPNQTLMFDIELLTVLY
ncbi:MAG: FKBP-type peptidyl-prolyl cis-trans isomerase [Verrucomicrobiota bacterium]